MGGMWTTGSAERRVPGVPRRDVLIELPARSGGPFGAEPAPWWKRRRDSGSIEQSMVIGVLTLLIGVLFAPYLKGDARTIVPALAVAWPVALFESRRRKRARRDAERLLPGLELD